MERRRSRDSQQWWKHYPPLTILTADKRAALDYAAFTVFPAGTDVSEHAWHRAEDSAPDSFGEPSDGVRARDLILELERLSDAGDDEEAMARLLDVLEEHLRLGRTSAVNAILEMLDPTRVAVGVSLVALTITWHGRESLRERQDFFDRTERALRARLGVERADALLAARR